MWWDQCARPATFLRATASLRLSSRETWWRCSMPVLTAWRKARTTTRGCGRPRCLWRERATGSFGGAKPWLICWRRSCCEANDLAVVKLSPHPPRPDNVIPEDFPMQFRMQATCALIVAGLFLGLAAATHADPLTAKTAQGKVHGKTINDGKVRAFLGLPYAAPPVGDLRWKAPQPPIKWKGERDATKFGTHCAQGRVFEDMIFQDAGPSEDCLFLNVYTPADAKDKSKLPVMFWIHGGGYAGGASSEPRHNGDFLPLKGVMLVTINYRLGVFGFLATSELAKEANGATGNYGMLDMVSALQWVKANIKQFGGDPGNVTIFGESAGSFAVSTLMAAPPAQGLFHKVIGESGAAFSNVLH